MPAPAYEMSIGFIVASLWIGILYVYCVYLIWTWIRSMTDIRVWPIPPDHSLSIDIYSILLRASPPECIFTESEYILPPSIPRAEWRRLGDTFTANEHSFRDVPDN